MSSDIHKKYIPKHIRAFGMFYVHYSVFIYVHIKAFYVSLHMYVYM